MEQTIKFTKKNTLAVKGIAISFLRAGTDGNTEDFPKFGSGSTTDPGAYRRSGKPPRQREFSGKPDGRKPQQCFFYAGSDGRE